MLSKNRLKSISALNKKKIRSQEGKFLIEGIRMCREALFSDFEIEAFFVRIDLLFQANIKELLNRSSQREIEITEISEKDADALAETVHSQGVFCLVRQKKIFFEQLSWPKSRFVVIINAGQDPGNVGTIIRTCDWFGVDAVLLSGGTAELYNPKVVRSTMGSIFHLPIIQNLKLEDILPRLKQLGFTIYGADVNGTNLVNRLNYEFPLALIVGNENRGIDSIIQPFLDSTVAIPRIGKAESLNMAIATAIVISHIVTQQKTI